MSYKIYPTWDWGQEKLYLSFCEMSQDGKGKWNDIQIVKTAEEADYYLVVNYTSENLDYKKMIVFQGEPKIFRKTWVAPWNDPKEGEFFFLHSTEKNHNYVEWYIKKSYQELLDFHPAKSKRISSVTSNFKARPGHRWRFVFCIFLRFFFKDFDWFGKGVRPIEKKDDGVCPYKYTFSAENSRERNYFTEKITDGVLAECLTFYWGCPNVDEFIDPQCYVLINIKNPLGALLKIRRVMKAGEWEKRLPAIRKEKIRILNELNTLNLVDRILKGEIK